MTPDQPTAEDLERATATIESTWGPRLDGSEDAWYDPGLVSAVAAALADARREAEKWTRIIKGEGETGIYVVAYYHTLEKSIEVGLGSCIDGEWRRGPFTIPVAWMKLDIPTLAELGISEPVDEAAINDARTPR